VLKSTHPPEAIVAGWAPGSARSMSRCVRSSYRLGLMAAGRPCLLWVSGRAAPGVHALGTLTGPVHADDGGPVVPVRLVRLPDPVPRAELLDDPRSHDAEVLRIPAGSNPSWLTPAQFAAVLDRADPDRLGRWLP